MNLNQIIVSYFIENGLTLSVSESLTGGLLSDSIVQISGASKMFKGGVTTYTLEAKEKLLDIPLIDTVLTDGVDHKTSVLMAKNVCNLFDTDFSISTTGVAEAYSDKKECAYITVYSKAKDVYRTRFFDFSEIEDLSRERVRKLTVMNSLNFLSDIIYLSEH